MEGRADFPDYNERVCASAGSRKPVAENAVCY
jgi:hypothetical protein